MVIGEAVLLRFITAVAPDQNGGGTNGTVNSGLEATDGAFLLDDLLNRADTAGRSDLNCSGRVDPGDLSVYLDFLFSDPISAGPQSSAYCP
jgi:hypothetical protein